MYLKHKITSFVEDKTIHKQRVKDAKILRRARWNAMKKLDLRDPQDFRGL